jgi:DNA-binding NarL/FixJ family response regulator
MSAVVADSFISVHRSLERAELRLALVHDVAQDPAPLVSILAGSRIPPNEGVLPLTRIGELTADSPHAIVLAADFGCVGGLAAVCSLRRQAQNASIVVVARGARGGVARQILNAGAQALILEEHAAEALAAAVRAVVAGLVCVPRMARRLVAKPSFSHREKQVLELLVAGMTNRQIADQLYLAESTVKSHVASSFVKLGVRSRREAAALLLDPAEGLAATALPNDVAASASLGPGGRLRSV